MGAVCYSDRGRAKGAFFVSVRGRGRVYLPRKCRVQSPQARVANLLRGSVRDQAAWAAAPRPLSAPPRSTTPPSPSRAQVDAVRRPGPNQEVDHAGAHTFATLVKAWMAKHGLTNGALLRSQCVVQGILCVGEPFHTSWRAWHAQHADLRPIDSVAHAHKTRQAHLRQARARRVVAVGA